MHRHKILNKHMKNLTPGNSKKKRKNQSDVSLRNLTPGNPSSKRKLIHRTLIPSKFVTTGTSMHENYTRTNPSAATYARIDKTIDKAVNNVKRIDSARAKTVTRTQEELTMCLQFVLKWVARHRCLLSDAVREASSFFLLGSGRHF